MKDLSTLINKMAMEELIETRAQLMREIVNRHQENNFKEKSQYTDDEIVYSATSRCYCGAGLAFPKSCSSKHYWDCADILTGRAIPSGQDGSKTHTDKLPFMFWKIKSERQPSSQGLTTRPM